MSKVLRKILENSKFTVIEQNTEFLPRRIGLGYNLRVSRPEKSILKPIIKKKRDGKSCDCLVQDEESSEELSRMSHILKKAKR